MFAKILIATLTLLVLLIGIFFLTSSPLQAPYTKDQEPTVVPEVSMKEVTAFPPARYASLETSDIVEIIPYTSGEDYFTGLGFVSVPLESVPSEKGLRYVYEVPGTSLSIWVVDDEFTVYLNDELKFIGQPLQLSDAETIERANEAEIQRVQNEILQTLITTWAWQETRRRDEEVVLPNEQNAFTLTLNTDGSVQGTTDCNQFHGSYHIDSTGALTFNAISMTRMYCEGSQELDFITPLQGTHHVTLEETTLSLKSVDGGTVMILNKAI